MPLEEPVSPQPLGNYVGILPLKTYSNDLEGRDNISISSIHRLNVSVRKPRKKGKDKPTNSCSVVGGGGDPECRNPKISSLFDEGLPRVIYFSIVSYDWALREVTTLGNVKK